MSFLNPFHELFETKEYPHARTLRTTFGQKVSDTFWVFFGGINMMADSKYDNSTSKKPSPLHFGIFDYLTLGIPYILTAIPLTIADIASSTTTKLIALSVAAVLLLPRAIFAGAMTLVSLPFIGIAQSISNLFASKHKYRIKSHEVTVRNEANDSSTKTTLGALMKRDKISLEFLTRSTIKPHTGNKRFLDVELSNSAQQKLNFSLTLGSKKDDQLYKSLHRLNIGRMQARLELEKRNNTNSL